MQIFRCHLIKSRETHLGFSGYSRFLRSKIYEMKGIEKIFQFRLYPIIKRKIIACYIEMNI